MDNDVNYIKRRDPCLYRLAHGESRLRATEFRRPNAGRLSRLPWPGDPQFPQTELAMMHWECALLPHPPRSPRLGSSNASLRKAGIRDGQLREAVAAHEAADQLSDFILKDGSRSRRRGTVRADAATTNWRTSVRLRLSTFIAT